MGLQGQAALSVRERHQARRHDGRQGAGHLACCEALKQPGRQGAARLLQLRPRCRQRAGRLAAGTLAAGSAPPRLDGCAGGRAPAVMPADASTMATTARSEEHTSELQSRENLVCRLLLEKKKKRDSEWFG